MTHLIGSEDTQNKTHTPLQQGYPLQVNQQVVIQVGSYTILSIYK